MRAVWVVRRGAHDDGLASDDGEAETEEGPDGTSVSRRHRGEDEIAVGHQAQRFVDKRSAPSPSLPLRCGLHAYLESTSEPPAKSYETAFVAIDNHVVTNGAGVAHSMVILQIGADRQRCRCTGAPGAAAREHCGVGYSVYCALTSSSKERKYCRRRRHPVAISAGGDEDRRVHRRSKKSVPGKRHDDFEGGRSIRRCQRWSERQPAIDRWIISRCRIPKRAVYRVDRVNRVDGHDGNRSRMALP